VNRACAIVDDFLGSDEHAALWEAFQETIRSPESAGAWNRVYQCADGGMFSGAEPRRCQPSLSDVTPGGSEGPRSLRSFSQKLFDLVAGKPPISIDPWTGFSASTWVYRAGAGLEWHSDTGWLVLPTSSRL
jgi:hypothetical protein